MARHIDKIAAFSAICVVAAAGLGNPAAAEPSVFGLPQPAGTSVNQGASAMQARIGASTTNANPWVGQFLVFPGMCARFDVTSGSTDLEMVVVAPNGAFFRNDDSNIGSNTCGIAGNCPLVVIADTSIPSRGVYTVVIQHFAGTATTASFQLRAAQYTIGNTNCTNPVTPLGVKTASAKNKS